MVGTLGLGDDSLMEPLKERQTNDYEINCQQDDLIWYQCKRSKCNNHCEPQ